MARKCQANELFTRTLPRIPDHPVPGECQRDAVVVTAMPTLKNGNQATRALVKFAVCAEHQEQYEKYTNLVIFLKLVQDTGGPLLSPTWSPIRD